MKQIIFFILLFCTLNVSAQNETVTRQKKEQQTNDVTPKQTKKRNNNSTNENNSVPSSSHVITQVKPEITFDKENMVLSYGSTKLKMIKVEGGAFMMGLDKEDSFNFNNEGKKRVPLRTASCEYPQHYVVLTDFYISETCVPYEISGSIKTWNDAIKFTQSLSRQLNMEFRLPTEAEWEYSARGGKYSKGYKYPGTNYASDLTYDKRNELGIYGYENGKYENVIDDAYVYDYAHYVNPRGEGSSGDVIHRCTQSLYQSILDNRRSSIGKFSSLYAPRFRVVLHLNSEAEQMQQIVRFLPSSDQKVDLGLSVCWAGYNIGAYRPQELGNKQRWIETQNKNFSHQKNQNIKYYSSKKIVNAQGQLLPSQDRATVAWGNSWRLPTRKEIEELQNKCTWVWLKYEGTDGYMVIGPNGNSIFLPAEDYGERKIQYTTHSYEGQYYSYHTFYANYASSSMDNGIFSFQIQNDYLDFKPSVTNNTRYMDMTYRPNDMFFRAVCEK